MIVIYGPQNAATRSGRGAVKPMKALLVAALLSLAASTALSQNNQGQNDNDQGQNYRGGRPMSAPEIDPAQALGALAILSGTVAIIRGYRRNKK